MVEGKEVEGKMTSIKVTIETRNLLMDWKYRHKFSSIDSLIQALFRNTERLQGVISNG